MKDFNDFEYELDTSAVGGIIVRVKADLIRLFWGAGVGPQFENDIVAVNRSAIDTIAREKLVAGASTDGVVEVNAADWES